MCPIKILAPLLNKVEVQMNSCIPQGEAPFNITWDMIMVLIGHEVKETGKLVHVKQSNYIQ